MTSDSAAADEALAWLALLRAPGLGAATIRTLAERHGSARAVVAQARREPSIPSAARDAVCSPDR